MTPELVGQLVLGVIALVTGTFGYLATRLREKPEPRAFRATRPALGGTNIADILQHAIDRIELLERENGELRSDRSEIRMELSDCVRIRRRMERELAALQKGASNPNDTAGTAGA